MKTFITTTLVAFALAAPAQALAGGDSGSARAVAVPDAAPALITTLDRSSWG